MHFTLRLPYACLYAFHSVLVLGMHLRVSLSIFLAHASMHFTLHLLYACLCAFHCLLSLRMPLCVSLSTFPTHASMHFTLRLPYACLYAFYCALSLRMPLCISLSTFRPCSRSCGDVLRVLLVYLQVTTLQPELWGRASRATFVLKSCDFAAGAAGTYFAYYCGA